MCRHSLTHLVCLLLILPFTSSLIVSFSPTDIRQFPHMTAAFGPGSFNITYPLVLASPSILCTTTEDNYHNQIVLISRGNCTFAQKVYTAQRMGAAGVIIGDNTPDDQSPVYVVMPLPPKFSDSITIPSIFISSRSHNMIRRMICGNITNGCITNWVIDQEPVMATMNYMGELINPYDDYSASDTLKLAGFLLLILPVLWCLVAGICLLRKICRERRARQARNDVARHMPMVAYRRMSGPATEETRLSVRSPNSPPRIHNESCAICLEDFTPELQIKLLPCGHGFHQHCIDPWLNERSELCPICKSSILDHKQPRGLLGGCVDIVCCR